MILSNMMEEDKRAERRRPTKQRVSLAITSNQLVECVMFFLILVVMFCKNTQRMADSALQVPC